MKLHPDVVRKLRLYYSRGYSIASLMEHFALSRNCVTNVVKNRTHVHVSNDPALPPLVRVEGAVQVLRPSNGKRSKPAPATELSDKYAKIVAGHRADDLSSG